MSSTIVIREVESNEEFKQCIEVTQSAWKSLEKIDQIPTHIMKASSITGQFLVASAQDKILGYSLSFSKRPDTLYLHAIGVRESDQSHGIGGMIMDEMKKRARDQGYKKILLTYNPLLGINANLYIHKQGGTVDIYQKDTYCKNKNKTTGQNEIEDRFFVDIDLDNNGSRRHPIENLEDVLKITINDLSSGNILRNSQGGGNGRYSAIEIPDNWVSYKSKCTDNGTVVLLKYRDIFEESLIGHRIIDFLSFRNRNDHKNFYILSEK